MSGRLGGQCWIIRAAAPADRNNLGCCFRNTFTMFGRAAMSEDRSTAEQTQRIIIYIYRYRLQDEPAEGG
ncbi:hypothetical protein DNH61_25470 [Paenibacillus sambharensis]|uniref:Uncharacterized protein n=1 Tax=Paenibacillus sambharensis TaxID=1803190 RepID=A0A2W1LEY9_9BACL|nr:hypothetical protein DNH61_25470 [Paenibacillus sambharensis]